MNAIETGSKITPYSWLWTELASENATIATLAPARITDTCIQAKKVRSFAKNTLGSTFTGADRGNTTEVSIIEGFPAKAFDFFPTLEKKLNHPPPRLLLFEEEEAPLRFERSPTDVRGRGLNSSTVLPSGIVSISSASVWLTLVGLAAEWAALESRLSMKYTVGALPSASDGGVTPLGIRGVVSDTIVRIVNTRFAEVIR